MIDSMTLAVVDESPAGTATIERDTGRQAEEGTARPAPEARPRCGSMMLEGEEALTRPEDRVDSLVDVRQVRTPGRGGRCAHGRASEVTGMSRPVAILRRVGKHEALNSLRLSGTLERRGVHVQEVVEESGTSRGKGPTGSHRAVSAKRRWHLGQSAWPGIPGKRWLSCLPAVHKNSTSRKVCPCWNESRAG